MRIFISILSIWVASISYATPPELKFDYLGKRDGLSSAYVTSVAQDSSGFIWVGTTNGLNRIVGGKITTYYESATDSFSILNSHVLSLFCDSRERLWVCGNSGLALYDVDSANFKHVASDINPKGFSEIGVNSVQENSMGVIYAITHKGIYAYDEERDMFLSQLRVEDGDIYGVLQESDSVMWIGINQKPGILKYEFINNQFTLTQKGLPDFNEEFVTAIIKKNNILYIGTSKDGLYSYDPKKQKVKYLHNPDPDTNNILFLYKDRSEKIWTCDYTGLKYYNEQDGTFIGYYPTDELHSVKPGVNRIFQDRQGSYWVSNFPGGVGYSFKRKGFKNFGNNKADVFHSSNLDYSALAEDDQGRLWVGSFNGGIDVFNWKENSVDHILPEERGLSKGSVIGIFRDRKDQMMVATYNNGLFFYNPESERFYRKKNQSTNLPVLDQNDIRSVAFDEDNNYWLAVHGKGVAFWNGKELQYYNVENNQLANDWSNAVFLDNNSNLWVATSWGLSVLLKDESNFKSYFKNTEQENSLPNNLVNCVFQDRFNTIWIGTANGLAKYDAVNDCFKTIVSNEYICAIADDSDGYLWVSTSNNIDRIEISTGNSTEFRNLPEIGISEYLVRSCVQQKEDKYIMFGGVDGLIKFNPHQLQYNLVIPNVELVSLKLFNEEIDHSSHPEIINKSIGKVQDLYLNYSQNFITIGFESNNYIDTEKNQFAYKLEGFDKEWRYVGNKKEATYTNLTSGSFVFKVKSCNNEGIWNDNSRELNIYVAPPWYKKDIIKFALIFFIFIFVIILIRVRTRHLEMIQYVLEKQVKDQTDKLKRSNIELQNQAQYLINLNSQLEKRQFKIADQARLLEEKSESLKETNKKLKVLISTKDRLFSIIAHDLLNPFNSILGLTEVFNDAYEDIGESERINMVQTINTSAHRVYNLLQNLLVWSRSQTDSVKFEPVYIELKNVVYDTIDLFRDRMYLKNIKCFVDISSNLKVFADVDMLSTVIRNLLGNAIKFSNEDGEIHIGAELKSYKIHISIKDSGVGMDEEVAKNLFAEGLMHSDQGTHGEKGSGLGLVICKDFVTKNGGEIWVESQKGKGSTFFFTLDMPDL